MENPSRPAPSRGQRGSASCTFLKASAVLPAALLLFCMWQDISEMASEPAAGVKGRFNHARGTPSGLHPTPMQGTKDRIAPAQQPPDTSRGQGQEQPEKSENSVVVMTTTSESVDSIMRWTGYYRALGVWHFYIFANGAAAGVEAANFLGSQPGVTVFRPQDDPVLIAQQKNSSVWRAGWLRTYLHKPCNFELFVTQSLNMETALAAAVTPAGPEGPDISHLGLYFAQEENITWVAHLDLDELLYPSGSTNFSLAEMLAQVPTEVDNLVVPNYEAVPEHTHVVDPFTEVTLFKRNFHHIEREQYKKYKSAVARDNPNFFLVYGNGKSIARVQPNIRPNGAHRFAYTGRNATESRHPSMAVLHFPYTRFADLRGRRDRCDCLPTDEDASRCFMLEFDRQAFIQSSLLEDRELLEWYRRRVVFGNKTLVNELCHAGMMERIYLPRSMISNTLS